VGLEHALTEFYSFSLLVINLPLLHTHFNVRPAYISVVLATLHDEKTVTVEDKYLGV
jgi:hypothetical protein